MRARTITFAALGAGVAVAAGFVYWAVGPGASSFVTWLAQDREVWRLGRLRIEGLHGPHMGALQADRIALADEDGVWAEARDIEARWSPVALLWGDVDVASVSADRINVFRRPELSAPRPAGPFRPDVNIRSMRVGRIHLAEPVARREALLRLDGSLAVEDRALDALALNITRVDADTDRLIVRVNPQPDELFTFYAEGDPDGVLASALRVEGQPVRVQVRARGDTDEGEAVLRATIGQRVLANGDAWWDARSWRTAFDLRPARAPAFSEITRRFGAAVSGEARGARAEIGARRFHVQANSENVTLRIDGKLTDEWRIDRALRVALTARSINRLLPEFDLEAGGGSIEGDATFDDSLAGFRGRAHLERVGDGEVRADMAGPVSATWGARAIAVNVRFGLTPRGSRQAQRLLAGGRLNGRVLYDRRLERVDVEHADLESRALRLDARGRIGDESGDLAGNWRILDLAAASDAVSGAARGDWRATRARDAPWRLVADGAAQGFGADDASIAQMLGRTPRMTFDGSIDEGGVRVRRATVDGARLRAGATGRYADTLDLRVEASARGPIRLGETEIAGAIDATGRVTGTRARPRFEAQARMQRLDVSGFTIEAPVLDFAYDAGARTGAATLSGLVAGEAARAQAEVRAEENALLFSNLTAHAAGIDMRGQASFGPIGPAFDIVFSGGLSALRADATGQIAGRALLVPARGETPRLDLQAHIQRAVFGELRLSQASLTAQGPLDRLTANLQARGASNGSRITFDASGQVTTSNGRTLATAVVRGDVGGEALATRTPAHIEIVDGRVEAQASFIAGDGGADIVWRGDARAFSATARFDRAGLAPLAILFGARAQGALSGEARLASAGEGLNGAASLTIDDARLPARMRAPLDMRIDARLSPYRLTGSATATSADGLEASLEGDIPVSTNARDVRIALAPGGQGRASWRANGPADALWGLVGGLDQSLGGHVAGAGQIRFTARTLTGSGDLTLTGGRFEDKRAGLSLVGVEARLQFSETGASQFTVAARDAEGGTLSGSGAARGAQSGNMTLTLQRLRMLDREDLRATASGQLALAWTPQGATVTGALGLDSAELSLSRRSDVTIPEIEVVEINQADGDIPPPRPRAPGPTANLDLTVTAPGRVYTRGRGLDAEWSLNARVRGTSAEPLLYGEARVVRGQFALAGRPFDLERGIIRLDGPLEETRIELVAERRDPELTTRVTLGDRLFDPTITFSSDPALPEDEVLPNMLFGRAAEDLSALEAAQLAASLTELTGRAAFDLTGVLRAAIGLQRFDVRQGEGGVAVTGGRYLARNVYFEIGRSGTGEPGAKIEWRARRNLSLVTSFLSSGDQRVSVRWRKDY